MSLSLLPGASAFAASAPTVTVTESGYNHVAAQVSSGASVTFHASSNVSNPMYQFWAEEPSGQWVNVQNYSSNSTYILSNVAAGNYLVDVYVMSAAEVKAGDWSAAAQPYGADGVFVDSSLTLSSSTANTIAGKPVTVTATSSNIFNPLYQFWYKNPSGQWKQSGAYGSGTFTFTPSESGAYTFIAYAKSPEALNDPEGALYSQTRTINTGSAPSGSVDNVVVTDSAAKVPDNGTATDTVSATVTDAQGNPVSGISVTFTSSNSGVIAFAGGAGTQTATTLANGIATVTGTAGTMTGTTTITAAADAQTAAPITITTTPSSTTSSGTTGTTPSGTTPTGTTPTGTAPVSTTITTGTAIVSTKIVTAGSPVTITGTISGDIGSSTTATSLSGITVDGIVDNVTGTAVTASNGTYTLTVTPTVAMQTPTTDVIVTAQGVFLSPSITELKVTPAAISQLAVVTAPAATMAGTTSSIVVAYEDRYGNLVDQTTVSAPAITATNSTIINTAPTGTTGTVSPSASGTYTLPFTSYKAQSDATIQVVGDSYTVTASGLTVEPATTTVLSIGAINAASTANASGLYVNTTTIHPLIDAYGNVIESSAQFKTVGFAVMTPYSVVSNIHYDATTGLLTFDTSAALSSRNGATISYASDAHNGGTVTTPALAASLGAPTQVTATTTNNGMHLTWKAPAGMAPASYQVLAEAAGATAYTPVTSTDGGTAQTTVTGLTAGTTYTFEVESIGPDQNVSAPSAPSAAIEA